MAEEKKRGCLTRIGIVFLMLIGVGIIGSFLTDGESREYQYVLAHRLNLRGGPDTDQPVLHTVVTNGLIFDIITGLEFDTSGGLQC